MTNLIDRIEGAEAGSRALDRAIWRALEFASDGEPTQCPAYTTCVTAALALASRVLPGWFPAVEPRFFIDGEVVRWKATLIRPLWDQYNPVTDEWFERVENRTAATPALAMCAAILRAKGPNPKSSEPEGRE